MKIPLNQVDTFFITYDEPKKEEYWAKLLEIAPWSKRIDGVKGFDSAHKACAKQSETDRFITIDGDNIVYPEFFDIELNIPPHLEKSPFSWAGRNIINGLCYGNGGAKLWTKEFVLNMKTHENATRDEEKVDFCWDNSYIQLNGLWTETHPNGSPFQAFRAGFREGVKMTLDRGVKAGGGAIKKYLHPKNYRRLMIWASIGADVPNGEWAIYGTRLGIYAANIQSDFDISKISDYDWFKTFFNEEIFPQFECDITEWTSNRCSRTDLIWSESKLRSGIFQLDIDLKRNLDLDLVIMNAEQSAFFKTVYEPPKRSANPLMTEIEADVL